MMFGPSDADSVHSAQSMAWKIKIDSNDSLRQKFVDQTVPQAEYLGLTIPDEQLASNEDNFGEGLGGYDFSEPDWTECFAVISGDGPCNDVLQVTLVCKQINPRKTDDYGEVRWDCCVTNQDAPVVAQYDVLTLVAKTGEAGQDAGSPS